MLHHHRGEVERGQHVAEPCRLATLSFDGRIILTAGLSEKLHLLDRKGRQLLEHALEAPAVAIALGALAERVVVALPDGRILCMEVES